MTRVRWIAAVVAALGSGCIWNVAGSGRPRLVDATPVAPATTKAALFEEIGPPKAIAAAGEVVEFPTEFPGLVEAPGRRPFATQQADAWLVAFAARRPIDGRHRVYYWSSTSSTEYWYWAILVFVYGHTARLDELWVLIDEETGLVVDSISRRR